MDPHALRAHLGIDTAPAPLDLRAFDEPFRRLRPRVDGVPLAGSVLLEVSLDVEGRVVDARAVPRREVAIEGVRVEAFVRGERMADASDAADDARLGAAAAEAIRAVRFSPALRDGVAVPFTFRMTMRFSERER